MSGNKYWLGFNQVKGIGPVRLRKLLNAFQDIEIAWNASYEDLVRAGLSAKLSQRLVENRSQLDLERLLDEITSQGYWIKTWDDPDYPRHLSNIAQPPPLLFGWGELTKQDETAVAIVGTRNPTSYGRRVAQSLGAALGHAEVTVVSGLARGVDSIAHQEVLRAGGRTIAILGSGLDQIYPPENNRLAFTISQSGAVLSDYPLGTAPEAINFPPRNRLISGLSQAVVIVEAGRQSRAMITASFAADQGREVFSVPGPIYSPQSKGTNYLISQGARPLLHPSDLLEFLNLSQTYHQMEARQTIPTNSAEKLIMDLIRQEALFVDDICAQTEMSIEKITATLAIMELKGMVRKETGLRYGAVHEISPAYRTAWA